MIKDSLNKNNFYKIYVWVQSVALQKIPMTWKISGRLLFGTPLNQDTTLGPL